MSSSGIGNLVFIEDNMTREIYRDILQKQKLFKSVKNLNLGQGLVMQHNNGSEHRVHTVTEWLGEKGVERLKWSSFSLDLNLITHI